MSDLRLIEVDEFFFAIRDFGSLDVFVTARGLDEDEVFSRHEAFMARRPASARGRFYCASVDAGMCEAAFNAAVIEVVATFDLQLDGDLAGEYRIAA